MVCLLPPLLVPLSLAFAAVSLARCYHYDWELAVQCVERWALVEQLVLRECSRGALAGDQKNRDL